MGIGGRHLINDANDPHLKMILENIDIDHSRFMDRLRSVLKDGRGCSKLFLRESLPDSTITE